MLLYKFIKLNINMLFGYLRLCIIVILGIWSIPLIILRELTK